MIVITGASDGLGREIANLYKEAGKKILNVSLEESEYADINIVTDLREGNNIIQAANKVKDINEPIEIIINSVGVYNEQALKGNK